MLLRDVRGPVEDGELITRIQVVIKTNGSYTGKGFKNNISSKIEIELIFL